MLRLRTALSLGLLVSPLSAQQFVYQPGALPGVTNWSEGVECADVDHDGDLDIFFAEGEGYSGAGPKRQNVLIVNKQVETAPGVFADESVARLGAHVSNAKGVTTADVDGDGWVDALFANAFNTDTPFLYINRGAAQPGFFDMESSTRGLTSVFSSAGAQFGDLDDDGDLDLILCDSGASFLGGSGGVPHLYRNDGSGHFTQDAAAMNAPTKRAHMDVQLVDIDGDWDLDFFGACRASNSSGNHYLMLNDGSGNFSDISSTVPASSTNTYETEVGDLDGDTDLDLFFVSLSGFQEGHVRNNLVENGSLSFTAGTPLNGSIDDNEIALLDFDNDGLLDVLVGSLGSSERIYRNQGNLSFALNANRITAVSDSTLDAAIGDLDGDGTYDIVTSQGEGNQPQWANRLYLNNGSPDDVAPRILGIQAPASPLAWPVVVHGRMQDQVIDDGVTYVSAQASYVAVDAGAFAVDHSAGLFSPNQLNLPVGARVTFTNLDGTSESVTSATAPYGFDLALAASGGSAEYVFVRPGTYDIVSSGSGAQLQLVVSGSSNEVDAPLSGGGIYRAALPMIATPSGELAFELRFSDWNGNQSVSDSQVISAPFSCGTQTNYCSTSPNSVGAGALMTTNGSTSVAANAFELIASPVPTQPGLFFYSTGQLNGGNGLPFGNGLRCVGGGAQVIRLPVLTSSGAEFRYTLDFGNPPPNGAILAGSTWNFQCWYRDPAGGGAGYNLSDGIEVVFCQ